MYQYEYGLIAFPMFIVLFEGFVRHQLFAMIYILHLRYRSDQFIFAVYQVKNVSSVRLRNVFLRILILILLRINTNRHPIIMHFSTTQTPKKKRCLEESESKKLIIKLLVTVMKAQFQQTNVHVTIELWLTVLKNVCKLTKSID